eukprot:gb/GECG01002144.1/.p1 GENE.gb/GECG01002144.1/~~gb/GECG01002144.1/.p1  ORF type:complete len:668 (+),score=138.96 gb/GECG01002144.1/:1-2004(+)
MNRSRGARRESISCSQNSRPRPTTPGAQRVPLNAVDHNSSEFQDNYALSKSTKLPRKSQAKIARLSKSGPRRVVRNGKSTTTSTQSRRKHYSKKQDSELEDELLGSYTGMDEDYSSSSSATDTDTGCTKEPAVTDTDGRGKDVTEETVSEVISNLVETAAETAASEATSHAEAQPNCTNSKRGAGQLTPSGSVTKRQRIAKDSEWDANLSNTENNEYFSSSLGSHFIEETPIKVPHSEQSLDTEYSPSSTKWFETTEALVTAKQDITHLEQKQVELNAELEKQQQMKREFQILYERERERRMMHNEDMHASITHTRASAHAKLQQIQEEHTETCDSLKDKINQLEQEKTYLQEKVDEYDEEDRAKLRKELCEVTRERDDLQLKAKEKEREISSLSSQLESQREKREKVQKQSENARQEAEQLANELQGQLEEVESELEQAHKQIDEKDLTIEEKQQEVNRVNTQKAELESRANKLESQLQEQTKTLEELRLEQSQACNASAERIQTMEEERQATLGQKQRLEKELERYQHILEDYESSYKRLLQQNANINTQLSQSENATENIQQLIEKQEQEHSETLKSIKEGHKKTVGELREKYNEVKAKYRNFERQNQTAIEQMKTVLQITQHVSSKLQAKLPADQLKKVKGCVDKMDRLSALLEQHIGKFGDE